MPELPEIEVLRRSLEPVCVGAALRVLHTGPFDMRARGGGRVRAIHATRTTRFARVPWATPADLLHGAVVRALHRHGKQLAIEAEDGRVLVLQLGMSGQVLLEGAGFPAVAMTHRHVVWAVGGVRGVRKTRRAARARSLGEAHDAALVFRDPRRFGGVHTAATMGDLRVNAWRNLGPDALRITGAQLLRVLCGARALKCALLDQAVLAGVGNIYADEALFRAGLHPTTRAGGLTPDQCARLAAAIRAVLRMGVQHGGSTLRDHRSAAGAPGIAQVFHAVYGRAGKPCTRCGKALRAARLGGRATVFCGMCQPAENR